jgi:lipoate-protein ligase A
VLQHGSILVARLPFDETDLVVGGLGQPDDRSVDRARLREATVTLEELGAPTDLHVVADAITRGFRSALDIDFTSSTLTTFR